MTDNPKNMVAIKLSAVFSTRGFPLAFYPTNPSVSVKMLYV